MATSMQTYDVEISDVEYLKHGETPLLTSVFRPQGTGPFPIMIELHGGAWARGIVITATMPMRRWLRMA
jgi:acetyl esterase/lipase